MNSLSTQSHCTRPDRDIKAHKNGATGGSGVGRTISLSADNQKNEKQRLKTPV